MLQAMNTGHEGSLTTLHANSPGEVVSRLTTMVRYAADIPVEVVEAYIARALDVVVQMTRGLDGRRFISQVACMAYDEELRRPVVETVYRVPLGAPEDTGEWLGAPTWVDDLPALGVAAAEEVEAWKRHSS